PRRRRCHPPRLRLPLGECRLRAGLRRRGRRLHRPVAGGHPAHGQQDRGEAHHGGRGGPGRAGLHGRRARRSRGGGARADGRLPAPREGVRGRGRTGHAARTGSRRPRARPRGGTARGKERFRRRHAPRRALRHCSPTRGDPDTRRHPRHAPPLLRARVLRATPAPEDPRGVALPCPRRGAPPAYVRRRDRRPQRGHGRVRRRRVGDFYFLEVNTRLQVEHPVTEEVTGLDLVRLQILVAQGEPLPLRQEDIVLRGHAIEARVYAEDPRTDFLPSTGTLVVWEEGRGPGIRWESGVETGSEVSIHYDPMLAKVIAHAPTRAEALARLARALATTRAHGVRTNVPVLLDVLRHPEFAAGRFDTHFVGTHVVPNREPTAAEREADRVHAVAAALWLQERRRAAAPVLRGLPSGWRNNPSQPQEVFFRSAEATIAVAYRVRAPARIEVTVDGAPHEVSVLDWGADHIAILLDGVRRACRIATRDDLRWVQSALGTSELHEVPRFPPPASEEEHGGCRAPMPGRVLAVHCAPGDRVIKGQILALLEAMKMEHEVRAPEDGVVREVPVEPGQQVNAGDVLVVVDAQQEEASA